MAKFADTLIFAPQAARRLLLNHPCDLLRGDGMNSTDTNTQKQSLSAPGERVEFRIREQELLARVRELAQDIVERVNKALGDTSAHASLPTEEKPSLQ
jgi:hypothetical protein